MFASVTGAFLQGMTPRFIHVEADLNDGLPGIQLIGDLSSEVRESAFRIRTALHNAGVPIPPRKIVINLAPADLHKRGAQFDLAIAAAIAAVTARIPGENTKNCLIIGEVGLDGHITSVPGVLPIIREALTRGYTRCVLPEANVAEGSLIPGMELIGVSEMADMLRYFRYGEKGISGKSLLNLELESAENQKNGTDEPLDLTHMQVCADTLNHADIPDFADIRGQDALKRAALIAAAGFHNLLITGPPGGGKTMAASRLPYILPPMTREEQLEVTSIHSVAGILRGKSPLVRERVYRAPHHTITAAGLIGGGAVPRPGEATLAHKGVLFLDELPEFRRSVLELLRQPLEEHEIHLTRSGGSFSYPADFLFVGAMNPCPCGYFPDMNRCHCTEQEVHRYRGRISGPLLDRIDMSVHSMRVSYQELSGAGERPGITSEQMRAKVIEAWEIQRERYREENYQYNGRIPSADLGRWCVPDRRAKQILEECYENLGLSPRAYHRTLRVARTIADLDGSELIRETHVLEAVGYRCFEQK